MGAETPNDKEQANEAQPGDVEIKAAPADKAAGPEKIDAKAGEQKPQTTLEIVKAKREELKGRASAAAAGKTDTGSKSEEPAKAQAGADKDDGADDEKPEEKGDPKSGEDEDDEALDLSDVDTSKPGWYDRLTKEQKKTLDAKYPGISTIVNAAKAEAQRHIENAKKKASQQVEQKKPSAVTEVPADADLSEAIDLLYGKDTYEEGLERLLANDKSKGVIKRIFSEFVKDEMGVDLEERKALQPLADGISIAASKYPQLKEDDSFFDQVEAVLQEDEETYEAVMNGTNPKLIAAAFRDASAQVVRSRAAKKTDDKPKTAGPKPTERRENLERNTKAAAEQAGVKAGGSSRPAVQVSDAKNTAELVRSIRQQKDYQHLR